MSDNRRTGAGVALVLGSAASVPTGAAVGALAFGVLGPVGVVAVRQWVGAVVLLVVARPRLRAFTWAQWWPVLLLAGVFVIMNLSLYTAIERIGLGLAVTLEFLGPLSVAVLSSRRPRTLVCAVLAVAGVVLLVRPEPSTDRVGIAAGLLAAAGWAAYILLNRVVGARTPGVEGSAAAAGISAVLMLPVGIGVLLSSTPTPIALACAAVAGLLSTAVPYLADLLALRRVPPHLFGIAMSAQPVFATVVGFLVLGQLMDLLDLVAIVLIVAADVAVVATAGPRRDRPARGSLTRPDPRTTLPA